MLDNKLLLLIDETSTALSLANSIIEKDYYVTQVIQAISNTENDYFRLVFAGGTCLAKAHKVVKRMSEDIDFKIQIKETVRSLSKSQCLKKLKEFRTLIKRSSFYAR